MSTLIIGSNGSMGSRYSAILNYLGKPFKALDLENSQDLDHLASQSSGFIIATPTHTHKDYIRKLLRYKKPILCEKPICKDIAELKTLLQEVRDSRAPFRMVLQYELLVDTGRLGRSYYNYFKHGNDGIVWDCLQVVGLSRGEPELKENSPVWTCIINGRTLKIGDMDAAYIGYVQRWYTQPHQNLDLLLNIHEKTAAMEGSRING